MVARLTAVQVIQDVTLNQFTNPLLPGNCIRNIECSQYVEYLKDSGYPRLSLVSWNSRIEDRGSGDRGSGIEDPGS